MTTDLVVPDQLLDVRTGELLPATPDNAVALIVAMNEQIAKLNQLVNECKWVLLEESRARGKKTLELAGHKVVFSGGPESVPTWDLEVLERLRDLGLPDDRYDELVKTTVTVRVDANVAKQIAGANPEYADVIGRARSNADKAWSVSVR